MEFARELKNLYDEGWTYEQIAQVACRTHEYIRQYIQLVEKGEERLIQGVEQKVFPMSFAFLVASSDDAAIQNVLMDAFDRGIEPRVLKRRRHRYPLMQRPRDLLQAELGKP